MDEKLISVLELAEFLGVTDKWVWRACRERRIPYIQVGKYYRFVLEDVLGALEKHNVPEKRKGVLVGLRTARAG